LELADLLFDLVVVLEGEVLSGGVLVLGLGLGGGLGVWELWRLRLRLGLWLWLLRLLFEGLEDGDDAGFALGVEAVYTCYGLSWVQLMVSPHIVTEYINQLCSITHTHNHPLPFSGVLSSFLSVLKNAIRE
jgi:hypothetical protein